MKKPTSIYDDRIELLQRIHSPRQENPSPKPTPTNLEIFLIRTLSSMHSECHPKVTRYKTHLQRHYFHRLIQSHLLTFSPQIDIFAFPSRKCTPVNHSVHCNPWLAFRPSIQSTHKYISDCTTHINSRHRNDWTSRNWESALPSYSIIWTQIAWIRYITAAQNR